MLKFIGKIVLVLLVSSCVSNAPSLLEPIVSADDRGVTTTITDIVYNMDKVGSSMRGGVLSAGSTYVYLDGGSILMSKKINTELRDFKLSFIQVVLNYPDKDGDKAELDLSKFTLDFMKADGEVYSSKPLGVETGGGRIRTGPIDKVTKMFPKKIKMFLYYVHPVGSTPVVLNTDAKHNVDIDSSLFIIN